MKLLDSIHNPGDIKGLSFADLKTLAQDIRSFILSTVSQTGGHLAPNLGVIELTLALHYTFNTELDRIVWDVGHQSYIHKILTGRKERFSSLRQFDGLAGFPKREESLHDSFNTGHSSTSISAALGFALARDIQEEDYDVIAVIGDGALTGGQALEAMNQAGHLGARMMVILNDNEMSIAQNVGALSSYLNRLRADPTYTKRKRDIEYLLKRVPAIGSHMAKIVERVKDSLKYLLVPGMLFEELGFTYIGPIDGHNLPELVRVMKKARVMDSPVLLHILTQKGKGYLPALENPSAFHGVGTFNLQTGVIDKKQGAPTYTNIFSKTLVDLASRDERIVGITAAMPEGTGLEVFSKEYPHKFFDVGIAEQHAVTMASAMAIKGLRPVVAIYSTFLQRSYDQILHDVCLQNASVIFALDRAGLVGEDGPTHHGVFDYTYLRHIPNISVLAPKDEEELRHMLYTALSQEGPVALRYPRGQGVGVTLTDDYQEIPWGRGEIVSLGDEVLILAVGTMVHPALEVKNILNESGISATVVNARFIKPLDEELIVDGIKKHPYLVTMEENILAGGFGSAVNELMASRKMESKVLNIGLPDEFITHGNVKILKETLGLTPELMAERIMEFFSFHKKKRRKILFSFRNRN